MEDKMLQCPQCKIQNQQILFIVNPNVDFFLFGFGSIKTSSAFCGSINPYKKPIKKDHKETISKEYQKFISYDFIKQTIEVQDGFLLIFFPNRDYKEFLVNSIRGFYKNPLDILQTYRFRVSNTKLAMLDLRMQTFDIDQFNMSISRQLIGQGSLMVAYHGVGDRKFGQEMKSYISLRLYPVVVPDPKITQKILNQKEIDAQMEVTQLDIVESLFGSSFQYSSIDVRLFIFRVIKIQIQNQLNVLVEKLLMLQGS